MGRVSVAEAAELLGVSARRVQERISQGSLPAARIGHQWTIDEADLELVRHTSGPGRPMSSKSAWTLLAIAVGDDQALGRVSPAEVSRGRGRLRELVRTVPTLSLDEAAVAISRVLGNRADRVTLTVASRDADDLRSDERLHLAGLSSSKTALSAGQVVEGYVASADLENLVDDYLLTSASHSRGNVILHVVPASAVKLLTKSILRSPLLRAADLAEHLGARERQEAVGAVGEVELYALSAKRHPDLIPGGEQVVQMPVMNAAQEQSWFALMDLYEELQSGWTLIGGQLVHLHCAERGVVPARPTNDVDTVVDIRMAPDMLTKFTSVLKRMGFKPETSGEGHQHRWVRDKAQIDVLIPEGVGERAATRHGVGGAPTVQSPGTTQALKRSETVDVAVGDRGGRVLRPNIVGALVGKAAARTEIAADRASGRHCTDFVILASLISARDFRGDALSAKDRKRLGAMVALCRDDPAALVVDGASDALDRLERAAGLSGSSRR